MKPIRRTWDQNFADVKRISIAVIVKNKKNPKYQRLYQWLLRQRRLVAQETA
jgi:flagellar biosynthesis/type III secretory pathway M-ring protein FliF/YscJ